jgi:hypothetical protein
MVYSFATSIQNAESKHRFAGDSIHWCCYCHINNWYEQEEKSFTFIKLSYVLLLTASYQVVHGCLKISQSGSPMGWSVDSAAGDSDQA